jgi:DNA repair protein RecO (recombination protein O)
MNRISLIWFFMKPSQASPAFLLHSLPYGESDQILTFFTQHEGKIRGFARSAKKSRKRFGGALDYFHLIKLSYRPGRGDLFHIDSLELIRRSERILQNLNAFAFSSYFLELVRELTEDHHADPHVFDLLHAAIRRMEVLLEKCAPEALAGKMADLARFFEIHLLDLLGFRPVLDRCVHCDRSVQGDQGFQANPDSFFVFHIERGGVLCFSCQKNLAGKNPHLSAGALQYMQKILSPVSNLPQPSKPKILHISAQTNRQVSRVMTDFIRHHTHKTMRALDFLQQDFR